MALIRPIFIIYSKHHLSRFEREQEDSIVHISHSVENYEFFYEPFYVSLDNAPPFEERFVGYGFTRNTQVSKVEQLW
jgi:hypothetical protein